MILAAGAILGLVTVPAITATAITGGNADGNGHPNVGMILFFDGTGTYRCTATLVTPTVLLTAAHCTDGTVGKTIVTFDSVIAEKAPSETPKADPAKGYTQSGSFTDVRGRTWWAGTAATHPAYSDFTDLKNWNDVGVVRLDQAPQGITPAKLAPTNYLDTVARRDLAHTLFTIVGYGTEVRKPDSGPQKPTPQSYPLIRRVAEAPGQKLTPQILQVNGNPNDVRGTGGSCFGDSGGPSFKDGYQVTVTSYGYTDNCRYIDGLQRVDIPVVQNWLKGFGVNPG
ncbi:MAG: trypsin-like serine protease [Intrasporangium sp.]|uniref:trypsin-like serine protease n=1 Tax=Intrasporangium sp. TaxID=1925024 RepID=UPI003F80F1F7